MAAEEHAMDAVAVMREKPEKLVRSLSLREAVLISILASGGKVMIIDQIRDEYLRRVYQNVLFSFKCIIETENLAALLSANEGSPKEPKVSNMDTGVFGGVSNTFMIKLGLTHLYKMAFPETKKVPLIIGGATIQRALEDLMSFYKNVIETRPLKDARTSGGYYINNEFLEEWQKYLKHVEARLAKNPFENIWGIEAVFLGMENRITSARTMFIKGHEDKARGLIRLKQFDKLREYGKEVQAQLGSSDSFGAQQAVLPIRYIITDEDEGELLKKMFSMDFAKRVTKMEGTPPKIGDIVGNDPELQLGLTKERIKAIMLGTAKKEGLEKAIEKMMDKLEKADSKGQVPDKEMKAALKKMVEEIGEEIKNAEKGKEIK